MGDCGRKLHCLRKVVTPNSTAARATRPSGPRPPKVRQSLRRRGRVSGSARAGLWVESLAAPRRIVSTFGDSKGAGFPPAAGRKVLAPDR